MIERQPAEMSHDELLDEALRLSEHRAQTYVSQERKEQITLKMNRVLFEIRYRDGGIDLNGNDAA